MLNKQSQTVSGTIINSTALNEGDLVRLRFVPGLYGFVAKKGLVDQNTGQPLLAVTWFLQFNAEKDEVEAIEPYAGLHSREALSLLTKKDEPKQ